MTELLLPRTDAGVAAQAAVVFPALLVGLVALRRDPQLRTFIAGLLVLTVALFGLRALH
jgi:hypothetical protein